MNIETLDAELESDLYTFLSAPQKLLIGGDWVPARSGETFDVVDPATGLVFASAASAGAADVDAAVKAARIALEQEGWRRMLPSKRAALLLDLADAMERDRELLAHIETRDNGMPLMAARNFGLGHALEAIRYAASWIGKLSGETLTASHVEKHIYTIKEPVGVVAAIMPWNAPLAMTADQLAGAVAAGCTVILKPAELTPLSTIRIGQLVERVGFPPGVINIITGFGHTAGAALTAHPGVDKVNFTGSTEIGKTIFTVAALTLKRVTLELGGKSPVIVFPDADIERAIIGIAMGVFANSGQICVAGSRLYVHAKIFDRVVAGIAERASALRVGSGLMPGNQIGPLISQRQLDRVSGYIESGIRAGASVVTGGRLPGGEGFFIEPTVLADTNRDMTLVQQEIFGPVVCAMRFEDRDLDAIAAKANDSVYGLSSYIWTSDLVTAHRLARKIRSGSVFVNSGPDLDVNLPVGGFKQSGIGRQSGREGFESYFETKTVSVDLGYHETHH